MGFVLDSILKKELIESPQVVSIGLTTKRIDIDDREGAFTVQFNYNSGNGSVDMDVILELSVDGETFVPLEDKKVSIVDDTGTIIWDIGSSGASYLRVVVFVRGGSMTTTKILYSAKRRH